MAGLPKRTSLRSSPEDAVFYRKYHDSTLSWFQKGVPHAELVQELIRLGVPEKTAERIVIAVEQEQAHSVGKKEVPAGMQWLVRLLIVVVLVYAASIGGYMYVQIKKDKPLNGGFILPLAVPLVASVAAALRRFLLKMRDP
jgi:hypothetical protein